MNTENQQDPIQIEAKGKSCPLLSRQMIFNIVILAGLIFCIILIFTGRNASDKENGSNEMHIGFISTDSLMSQYELFQDMKVILEAETLRMRDDLAKKEQSLQAQYQSYQKKAQSGNISYDDAKSTEQYLAAQQQELMTLSETYTNQIATKEYEMSVRVLDSLNVVIEIVNAEDQYDYILGYTQGAGILYANPKYDITEKVIGMLNERYNKGPKVTADETK